MFERFTDDAREAVTAAQSEAVALRNFTVDLTDWNDIFAESTHGRALAEAGFGEDLALCATIDSHAVVPIYADRQITKLGPERER